MFAHLRGLTVKGLIHAPSCRVFLRSRVPATQFRFCEGGKTSGTKHHKGQKASSSAGEFSSELCLSAFSKSPPRLSHGCRDHRSSGTFNHPSVDSAIYISPYGLSSYNYSTHKHISHFRASTVTASLHKVTSQFVRDNKVPVIKALNSVSHLSKLVYWPGTTMSANITLNPVYTHKFTLEEIKFHLQDTMGTSKTVSLRTAARHGNKHRVGAFNQASVEN